MVENGKISPSQFTLLTILLNLGGNILVVPSMLAGTAKQDSWIAGSLCLAIGLVLVWLYTRLGECFANMTLIEINEKLFGKWIGTLISIYYLIIFITTGAGTIRNVSDFLATQIIPETPILYIASLFVVVVVMGASLGLETFSRAAEIFFPWIALLFFILFALLLPEINIEHIQPVLGDGFKPIVEGIYALIGYPFLQNVALLMIFPYVNRIPKAKQAFYVGTWIGGGLLVLLATFSILILGVETSARHIYSTYTLARKINVGDFIQRIEAVVTGIWLLSVFFKATILLYGTCLGLNQIINLKDYRKLTFPFGIVLVIGSILYGPNNVFISNFHKNILPILVSISGLFLPLLSLVIARFRSLP
ncbi:endospore germination permease [Ammoniphilus sp. YIM 78166]|uniref:GerAB/ArcD/ProY family transporter n=1 Tax=Ammoniphilus sp. YIM 78166 TaxID=1644106 RepID=UPI00106F70D7|nr:endospore germination permease [Ammoniphilus sp. YIM 78166]